MHFQCDSHPFRGRRRRDGSSLKRSIGVSLHDEKSAQEIARQLPGIGRGAEQKTGLRDPSLSGENTVKALVKNRDERGLWVDDVPKPSIGINDVLIKVQMTGICGTDLHIYEWDSWARSTVQVPTVIGHEFVGEIVDVGSNVTDFRPGMVVSGEGHVVCGRCRNCLAGRRHLCAQIRGVGVNRPGAFAEYISLPMSNIWRHHPNVSLEVASIFDPFGNAVHTALSFPVLGEDVLITGAGPIGLMAASVARHAGARHIVITDVNPFRLELAKTMGVTLAVDPTKKTLAEVQRELGMVEGFDVGLEMSGNPTAFHDMLANMSHGGKIAMLGIPSQEIAIDWHRVDFQHVDPEGHLRPGNVRNLVQDDGDAGVGFGYSSSDYASLPLAGV